VATYLAGEVAKLDEFSLITQGDQLPVFAFTTSSSVQGWDVFAVSRALRARGWQVPAYTFPENRQDLAALRVVCRNGFSHDLGDLFLADLRAAVQGLNSVDRSATISGPGGFHH
jgi:glutamate decarboxylase